MVEDNRTRLFHILDACIEIKDFTAEITKDEFLANRMLQLAIIQLLEIIGEAANSITKRMQENHAPISWKQIIGMRHRLAHGYFDVDLEIVWQTIKIDIPTLHSDITNLIKKENFSRN